MSEAFTQQNMLIYGPGLNIPELPFNNYFFKQ